MPVSPDHGARLAATSVDVVTAAELEILRRISRALSRGADAPAWARVKLAELQMLRARWARDLAAMEAGLVAEAGSAVRVAYQDGQALAVGDLDQSGARPNLPPAQLAAVQTIVADLNAGLAGVATRALRSVTDAYQETVAVASSTVLLGAQTRLQAAQGALDRLLGQGIDGFRDRAGRNWRLESYVEMAVRTSAGQAAIAGHLDVLAASGEHLVQIIPGPRACPICDGWAGKVVSLSPVTAAISGGERVEVFGTMEQARQAGVFHPNCRCSVGIYIPGITELDPARPDPAGYEAVQEQRRLERGVRDWKRREALALTPEAARQAKAKTREWQARLRQHVASDPELRRKPNRERINTAL
ncbi:phage minor capsid protein [Cellulosimicrobium cellulans]|uniref:phage minor capsid protein n=1 Tax=Cellulosimicrobium cellulans TaxID=1710 RepID=UPI001F069A40|nr:phage minor capsid protein [Cellulosimicrobium cellulans]